MKCEEFEKVMIDYLDNSLEGTCREDIEKHLASCERCMDEVKDFQHILHTISTSNTEVPDDALRINFYHMLHAEMQRQKSSQLRQPMTSLRIWTRPFVKVAAALALLIIGTFLGMMIKSSSKPIETNTELSQLKKEVSTLKEVALFRMLNEESPSERIKAVNYSEEIPSPDKKVFEALIATLNLDKNVNVRLAAAYSLSKFTDRKQVRDSLVESLARQTDPIIQIVLMNILVEKKESSAIKSIQKIISDKNTLKEVKDAGEKSIVRLL